MEFRSELFCIIVFTCLGKVHNTNASPSNTQDRCPLWKQSNNSEDGYSMSKKEGNYAVKCSPDDEGNYHISLLPCYCITQNNEDSAGLAVAGLCPYTCSNQLLEYIPLPQVLPNNISELTSLVCQNYSRTGQLCGQCAAGYAPAVYAFTLECVNCTEYKMNWLKYIGIAFGPQTIFFVLTVFSSTSVTSGKMVGYVTVSQVLATTIEIRFKTTELQSLSNSKFYDFMLKYLATVYGIWNLDFFRSLYTPFCLNPNMPMLAVISLDYAVALYPIFLIMLTYVLLTVYDNYKAKLCWWIPFPFQQCIYRYYQMFSIRMSVIDAFATMLILSYVKILNTSFELLLSTPLTSPDNEVKEKVVYYSGGLKYLGKQHLPYAVLALSMLLIFNAFPLIVLTVYPCRYFHRCLNFFGRKLQRIGVHNIMDEFYRSYKTTPRDCRYFAVFYLYLRVINLLLLVVALSPVYFSLISILYLCMAMLIGLVQPHKQYSYNIINACLFAIIAISKILEFTIDFSATVYQSSYVYIYRGISLFLIHILPLYGLLLLMHKFIPKKLLSFLKRKISAFFEKFAYRSRNESLYDESFPHRVSHADEYAHLINVNNK